jgi:hypothetical protein
MRQGQHVQSLNDSKQVTNLIESGGCISWIYWVPAPAHHWGKLSGLRKKPVFVLRHVLCGSVRMLRV